MMKNLIAFAFSAFLLSCAGAPKTEEKSFIDENIDFARAQIGNEIGVIEASGKCLNPVTLKTDSSVYYCGYADWRSGFFPGSVWYLYELTGDSTLLPLAAKYTDAIEEAKNLTWHHDIGFIVNCSFGNGLRLAGTPSYKDVMVQAAKSLSTRFRPAAGIIQSWDVERGWQSERGWECPVIIDNMMNLELMFEATRLSGDSSFYKIAVSHADRTMEEHFRPDGSCYHVIDYSIKDGKVRHRQTAQGYADESIWSRGQAWAIYGYAVCYRETKDRKYLDQALKTFNMMKNLENMPEDLIPYWDMSAPNIPNEPRDVSTASCIASALYEISTMDVPDAAGYKMYADSIMVSLSSPAYRAALGTADDGILISELMETEIISVRTYTDKEEVAQLFRKYDLLALPVLDKDGLMVGIVTFDDAMDVMVEEATEDITKMAAINPSEKTYFNTSTFAHAKNRIPWLLILMLTSIITGTIITKYEDAFAAIPLLVSFIPMLMDTGGNCGSQSSTLVIRGLALSEIHFKDIFKVIFKEFRISIIVGAVLALTNGVRILIQYHNPNLALVIALSLIATVIISKLIGCILPLVASKVHLDPAIMASPLITTLVDTFSILIYFNIASLMFRL